MTRWILALCLGACGGRAIDRADAQPRYDAPFAIDAAAEDPLGEALDALRAAHRLPALAAIEVREGRVRSAAVGLRRADGASPVSRADRWLLNSNTKAMTAALLAVLAREGRIGWDTTLADAFPDVEIDPRLRAVTLGRLLVHRGGLPEDREPTAEVIALLSLPGPVREARAELVRRVLSRPPAYEPGTEQRYSNFGYVVVGAALERTYDASWEELIRARLFAPLGMSSCGFGPPAATDQAQPASHRVEGERFVPVPQAGNPPLLGPAATVHCSLEDWGRFLAWTTAPEQGPLPVDDPRLFEAIDGYAPGWIVTTREWSRGPVLTHAGSDGFTRSVAWVAPAERRAFAAVTNAASDDAAQALDGAIAWLLRHAEQDD